MKAEEYARCRSYGMTYQQIANQFGVTRQAVQKSISKYQNCHYMVKPETVCFAGLRRWMTENHIKVADLERGTGCSLYHALRSGNIKNEKVNAILRFTGLTYEEAFGNLKTIS